MTDYLSLDIFGNEMDDLKNKAKVSTRFPFTKQKCNYLDSFPLQLTQNGMRVAPVRMGK